MNPADEYIRIALAKAGGNKTIARKTLIDMAAKDAHVAQLLAAAHLEAICSHAIDRYLRVGTPVDLNMAEAAPAAEEKPPEKPKEIPPTEASDKHRDAVMKMVAAFKKKE